MIAQWIDTDINSVLGPRSHHLPYPTPRMTDEQRTASDSSTQTLILMQLVEHLVMNNFVKHIGKILQNK